VVGRDHEQRVLPLALGLQALDEALELAVLVRHRLVVQAAPQAEVAAAVDPGALEREVVELDDAGRAEQVAGLLEELGVPLLEPAVVLGRHEEPANGGGGSFGWCTSVVWKWTQ
jgi:hypothetical protein